jgi:hypothetical protein
MDVMGDEYREGRLDFFSITTMTHDLCHVTDNNLTIFQWHRSVYDNTHSSRNPSGMMLFSYLYKAPAEARLTLGYGSLILCRTRG